ncbi:MAG TPA: protein kinase [Gemmatimonadaceae bacterium]|nr:protein kinase [Gemmatimonadaceae bacterium]
MRDTHFFPKPHAPWCRGASGPREFLEGSDLHSVGKARSPLPIHEAVGYLVDMCKAMEEAHAVGIVDRDLKPQNLFLTHRFDGTPLIKIFDFGISKFTGVPDAIDILSTKTGLLLVARLHGGRCAWVPGDVP